ncbi:hypothetical protein HK105_200031 [Polyrhizophydium stewartii]|uniref:Uncharacterized protein n=1 Tax=Polyrhizophydium stewartii TaxID=2732419 RepID=A0ABR4NKE9_9FUNG
MSADTTARGYTSSLATISSIVSSIVVYGAGISLTNAKTRSQALSATVAGVSFLAQRIIFLALVENVAGVDCIVINGVSYSLLVAMRLAVLFGLLLRAQAANRALDSMLMRVVTYASVALGLASIGATVLEAVRAKYPAGSCFQDPNQNFVLFSNLSSVMSVSILTVVIAVPVFRALAGAGGARPHTRVEAQAHVLSKVMRLTPLLLCAAMIGLTVSSSSISNSFLFRTVLVLTDFSHVWLLLFPMVVMAGDNGSSFGSGSGERTPRTALSPAAQQQAWQAYGDGKRVRIQAPAAAATYGGAGGASSASVAPWGAAPRQ